MNKKIKQRWLSLILVTILTISGISETAVVTFASGEAQSDSITNTQDTASNTEDEYITDELPSEETAPDAKLPSISENESETVPTETPVITDIPDTENADIAQASLEELLNIALTDGGKAAELLEAYTIDTDYEEALRQLLIQYYTEDPNNQLENFLAGLGERSTSITAEFEAAAQERSATAAELGYKPNEILVVFKDDIAESEAEEVVEGLNSVCSTTVDATEDLDVNVIEISPEYTVEQAVEAFEAESDIAYAQPNYVYEIFDASKSNSSSLMATPNDPMRGSQYYLNSYYTSGRGVNAYNAWDYFTGIRPAKIRVAVIDTGVDVNHIDLQVALNKNLSVDATDGAFPQLKGDLKTHGTHVSGIIAATSNNGTGIAGVASGMDNNLIELMSINASYDGEHFLTEDIVRALRYAQSNKAKVANMSLGSYSYDYIFEQTIKSCRSGGMVLVAAAGNDNTFMSTYPADYSGVISVVATNSSGTRYAFSNYGDKDICAPGQDIYSTLPGNTYGKMSGTSMATPVISAVVAMMFSVNPTLSPAQVEAILYNNAIDLGTSGYDELYGWGIVDAAASVKEASNYSGKAQNATTLLISASSVNLFLGKTKTLYSAVFPSYSNEKVTWSSSNKSVATVNSKTGKITAKGFGSTTITAKTPSGLKAKCTVKVTLSPFTSVKVVSQSDSQIKISWSKITGAKSYKVYRNTSEYGTYSLVKETTKTSLVDSKRSYKKTYYYIVRASSGSPSYQIEDSYTVACRPFTAKATSTGYNSLKISWTKVSGASKYEIYRASGSSGTYKLIKSVSGSTTSYSNTNLTTGSLYSYKVKVIKGGVGSNSLVARETPKPTTPKLKISRASSTSAKLSWGKIGGATAYKIYRNDSTNSTYQLIKTTTTTTTTTLSYTDKNLSTSKNYNYKVYAVRAGSSNTTWSSASNKVTFSKK